MLIAAVTLAVLAATTGCASSSTTAAKPSATPAALPSIPATTLYWYFKNLRDPGDGGGGDDQRLAAGHTPDSVLIEAGVEVCTGLHAHKLPSDIVTQLQQKGWDEADAAYILLAAGHSRLCKVLGLGPTSAPSS